MRVTSRTIRRITIIIISSSRIFNSWLSLAKNGEHNARNTFLCSRCKRLRFRVSTSILSIVAAMIESRSCSSAAAETVRSNGGSSRDSNSKEDLTIGGSKAEVPTQPSYCHAATSRNTNCKVKGRDNNAVYLQQLQEDY